MNMFQSGCKNGGGGNGFGALKVNFWCDGSCYNEWLQRENNHTEASGPHSDNKTEPFVFPFDGQIKTLAYINKNTDSDTDIQVFKNGTLQTTWEIRNKKWSTKSDFTAIEFVAGDKLSIFADEVGGGSKPDDLLLDVFIVFTSAVEQELGGVSL